METNKAHAVTVCQVAIAGEPGTYLSLKEKTYFRYNFIEIVEKLFSRRDAGNNGERQPEG
jgi:hypothetical protein